MLDRLPIYEIERDIIARLKTDRRLILSAPTLLDQEINPSWELA